MQRFVFVCIFLLCASPAVAKPLSADASSAVIELHAAFRGTEILLFGARNEPGDIVIAVRGPMRDVTVREKQRIAGMWMYVRKTKYDGLPQFMALASTRDFSEMGADALFKNLSIDLKSMIADTASTASHPDAFDNAVIRIKSREKLYSSKPAPIRFFGETLFKTRIHFPDTMPRGQYQAEVYLIDDGKLIGAQILPIMAVKTGFEAWLFEISQTHALLYGLLCISVALSCGWFAHRVFRKR